MELVTDQMTVVDDLPEWQGRYGWHLLDDDHAYRFLYGVDDEPLSLVEVHRRSDTGAPCWGAVPFVGQEAVQGAHRWNLVSINPLHLEPSLLCRSCGSHGSVRAGKWESA